MGCFFFFFSSSVCLPIISCGGLTVSGGGSMTGRAAALRRTDRLQTTALLSQRLRSTRPGSARLFTPLVHVSAPQDEVKRRPPPSGATRIRWSPAFRLLRRPTPRSTSLCGGNNTFPAMGVKRETKKKNLVYLFFPPSCFCIVIAADALIAEAE